MLTGGAGLIGRAIASHLLERGHQVHLTDIVPETNAPHTTYAVCDILDFHAVSEQVRGCDAVVHMAALASPYPAPGQDVYRINTMGTFNVFEAAAKAGIRRVVQASSINALGCAWNTVDFSPRYFPIDEDHPQSTSDPYSFSKQQVEDIGEYFWRRDQVSSVAFRFPWIYRPGFPGQSLERWLATRSVIDRLLAMPAAERSSLLEQARRYCLTVRGERRMEYPNERLHFSPDDGIDPVLAQAYTIDRFNLWVWLDVRDAARAVEHALATPYEGAHALFVNNPDNFLDYDTTTLAALFFPDVTEWRRPITGAQALISTDRARALIGFEPHYIPPGVHDAENR
jgi:nucleoside-diphosphate-sugar epimerase